MPSSDDDSEKLKSEEKGQKRPTEAEDDEDSDDGWIGPTLGEAAPVKKKKNLPFESVYLDNLPKAETYERSYMHRDVITWCLSSGPTGFVITGSIDGHVKFWKKREVGIEFVKHFRAHLASVKHMTVNSTGTLM
jgi:peptidylprolyl isomerase domain and WD repeat-containing protein 1